MSDENALTRAFKSIAKFEVPPFKPVADDPLTRLMQEFDARGLPIGMDIHARFQMFAKEPSKYPLSATYKPISKY
jgi:hypothetical protein